jgi:predicted enzyme related to lactoylglutathione lyase
MPINTTSIQHIRLTVTDITRSRKFYDSVFGWPVALEVPVDADAETRQTCGFSTTASCTAPATFSSVCGRWPTTDSTKTG